jgi:hypothetical protein
VVFQVGWRLKATSTVMCGHVARWLLICHRVGVLEDRDGGDITPLADASKRGLASDDSAWITGEQILAGGGLR